MKTREIEKIREKLKVRENLKNCKIVKTPKIVKIILRKKRNFRASKLKKKPYF